jgi:cytochrome c553
MKRILKWCASRFLLVVRGFARAGRALWALLGSTPGRSGMKRWLLQIATLALLAGVGGFLFAASGIMPISASSGHWPITAWFLNFSMERSVSTHTIGMEAPPLDDPDLVLKGAGHYEIGCFPCHGSPVLQQPRIARAMTPHPPYLPPAIRQWEPEELFYIVKHGVKFTGMPAWPTQQRDDEVWAMVAFLQKLPELEPQEYRQLVSGRVVVGKEDEPIQNLTGPDAVPRTVSDNCGRCHGNDGQGRGTGAFPKLAGQQSEYFAASLQAYARGQRHSGIMEPIAAGLSEKEMQELGRYYHSLAIPKATPVLDKSDAAVERGAVIALAGVPNQRIPVCAECHGPGDKSRNPNYPTLAGQYADYLVLQLELFKTKHRGGTDYSSLMQPVAERLTSEQMRDVAVYYESLKRQ